jgi:hypothetical protein
MAFDTQTIKKGEMYFKKGKVLWVVKYREMLFSKVLGVYPYYVEVNLKTEENKCSCPLGRDCKHSYAALTAYQRGFYIETENPLVEIDPQAIVEGYSSKNPEFGLKILLKELKYEVNSDESGSRTIYLFRKALKLLSLHPDSTIYRELLSLFKEFYEVFEDYNSTNLLLDEFKEFEKLNSKYLYPKNGITDGD